MLLCSFLVGLIVWSFVTIGAYKLAYRIVFAARVPLRAVSDPAVMISVVQATVVYSVDHWVDPEPSVVLFLAFIGLRVVCDFGFIYTMVPTPTFDRMSVGRALGMTAVVAILFGLVALVVGVLIFGAGMLARG